MPPARLVFLLQDLAFGGTQRQALELAAGLDRSRFRVELWTLMGGEDFAPQAERLGLGRVALGRGRPRVLSPGVLLRLARRLRSRRPDLLFLLTVLPNIWGRICGRFPGGPVVVAGCRQSGDPLRQHERLLKGLAHHHVCNARALGDLLARGCRVPPERISVIHNGVDLERFLPPTQAPAPSAPVILSIGRLVPDKDQESLVEAFRLIADRHPRAALWLCGDGRLRGRLASAIDRGPLRERIRLLPARAEVEDLYQRAAIFALPSRREGLPNVVLEAMASGLPVVATHQAGLPELVRPGLTGLLVPPGDSTALARALDRLLADPRGGREMGAAGRRTVEREFGLDRMTTRFEALFAELIGRRAASP